MKKLFYSMFAFAMAAMTLTSCEDVPMPYDMPVINPDGGEETPEAVAPTGTGTLENPYNISGVIEFAKSLQQGQVTDKDVYFKGKVSEIRGNFDEESNGRKYGNATFYLTDNGSNTFYVYRAKYLENKAYTDGMGALLAVDDEVIVCGKLTNYNGTLETEQNNAYVYSLNGVTKAEGGSTTPDVSGKGTESDPYDVASAIAKASQEKVFVKGYIVGYVSGQVFSEGATFSTSGEVSATNLLLAASANETDASKCMPVQLPSGTVRTGLNLKDNPGNLKKAVLLYGDIATYFGVPGFKNTSYAKIDGKDVGNKPGGGDTPTPSTGVYSMDFKSKGQGEWTISDKTKPSEIASIWKYDNRYGMVATAYASSVNYDSESMLVSPKFNLTGVSKATLKIRHAINFFSDIDTAKKQALVLASTDGTNWTELTLSNWPTSLGWTFFDATADMTSFAGKSNVQIALKYISTATKAGTWEIESVSVE